jgi:hypothetical protein
MLPSVCVDGLYKPIGLLIRHRVDVAQDFIEGEWLRSDEDGLVTGIPKIIVHIAAPEAKYTPSGLWHAFGSTGNIFFLVTIHPLKHLQNPL